FSFLGFVPLMGIFLEHIFIKNKLIFLSIVLFMLAFSLGTSGMQFGPAPKDLSAWISEESKGADSVIIMWNIRSALAAQTYYMDSEKYIMPVSGQAQLASGLQHVCAGISKVFTVRYFHRDDPLLMDRGPIEIEDAGSGFKLNRCFLKDYISVCEYIK
ncbi:MAG: hypothetical protein JW788_07520, partial [Candidatus Omnitrophica bacterium]|nr:hypothetical protein [Candidatus Omnitrophota bacterium]